MPSIYLIDRSTLLPLPSAFESHKDRAGSSGRSGATSRKRPGQFHATKEGKKLRVGQQFKAVRKADGGTDWQDEGSDDEEDDFGDGELSFVRLKCSFCVARVRDQAAMDEHLRDAHRMQRIDKVKIKPDPDAPVITTATVDDGYNGGFISDSDDTGNSPAAKNDGDRPPPLVNLSSDIEDEGDLSDNDGEAMITAPPPPPVNPPKLFTPKSPPPPRAQSVRRTLNFDAKTPLVAVPKPSSYKPRPKSRQRLPLAPPVPATPSPAWSEHCVICKKDIAKSVFEQHLWGVHNCAPNYYKGQLEKDSLKIKVEQDFTDRTSFGPIVKKPPTATINKPAIKTVTKNAPTASTNNNNSQGKVKVAVDLSWSAVNVYRCTYCQEESKDNTWVTAHRKRNKCPKNPSGGNPERTTEKMYECLLCGKSVYHNRKPIMDHLYTKHRKTLTEYTLKYPGGKTRTDTAAVMVDTNNNQNKVEAPRNAFEKPKPSALDARHVTKTTVPVAVSVLKKNTNGLFVAGSYPFLADGNTFQCKHCKEESGEFYWPKKHQKPGACAKGGPTRKGLPQRITFKEYTCKICRRHLMRDFHAVQPHVNTVHKMSIKHYTEEFESPEPQPNPATTVSAAARADSVSASPPKVVVKAPPLTATAAPKTAPAAVSLGAIPVSGECKHCRVKRNYKDLRKHMECFHKTIVAKGNNDEDDTDEEDDDSSAESIQGIQTNGKAKSEQRDPLPAPHVEDQEEEKEEEEEEAIVSEEEEEGEEEEEEEEEEVEDKDDEDFRP